MSLNSYKIVPTLASRTDVTKYIVATICYVQLFFSSSVSQHFDLYAAL